MKKMFALNLGVIVTLAAFSSSIKTARCEAIHAEVSEIVITSYTGSDAAHTKPKYIYRLLLRSDGTAVYVGNKTFAFRTGRHHGTVARRDFLLLAGLLDKKWKSSYTEIKEKPASQKFEVVSDSKRKTIWTDGYSGPQDLRHAHSIFYGLLWKIRWHKVSNSDAISD